MEVGLRGAVTGDPERQTSREVVRRHLARLRPAEVDRAIERTLDTVDLSGLAPVERTDRGIESAG